MKTDLRPIISREPLVGEPEYNSYESQMPLPDLQAEEDAAEYQRQADLLAPTEEESRQAALSNVVSTIGKIGANIAGAYGGFKPQTAPIEAADQLAEANKKDRQSRIQALLDKAKARRDESKRVREQGLSDVFAKAKLRGLDQEQAAQARELEPISEQELSVLNTVASRRGIAEPLFTQGMSRRDASRLAGQLKEIPAGNWVKEEVPQPDGSIESVLVDKTTGDQVSLGKGKKTGVSGLDAPAPKEAVDNANVLLKRRGLAPLNYGVTQRDVQAAVVQTGEVRRSEGNLINIGEGVQDPHQWLAAQPAETKKAVVMVQGSFNKDLKDVQEAQKDLQTLEQLAKELEAGNAYAGQALKNRLPRAIGGEKGVLTDQDVNRLAGSQKYIDQAKRWYEEKIASGTAITKQDLAQIRDTIASIKDAYGKGQANAEQRALAQLQSYIGPNADTRLLYAKSGAPAAQPVSPAQQQEARPVQVLIGGKWVTKQLSPGKIEELKRKNPAWVKE